MTLSTLNNPPLIAVVGAVAHAAFPYIQGLPLSYNALRAVNLLSYGLNVYSVSQPGRIDGEQARNMTEAKEKGENEMAVFSPDQGRTLVAPSGWAFIIWAPIYLGELALVAAQFFVPEASAMASILKKISIPFSFANIFQSLWCASFRPKYKGTSAYISTAMLGSIAYSLSKAHAVYTGNSGSYTVGAYSLFLLPLSLHFGWTTAATLVNWNGSVAKQGESIATPRVMAALGHSSAVLATVLGVYTTVTRNAPVYGGVIAWALSAVADGMKRRLAAAAEAKKTDEKKVVGYTFGARPMQWLSNAGAVICATSSVLVAASLLQGKKG